MTLVKQYLLLRLDQSFFCLLFLINLAFFGVLEFSKSINSFILIPTKLLHFFGFGLMTGFIHSITEIDDLYRVIWYWNYFNEILIGFTCFFLGGFGSEFIQLFLPWKVFSWGDLLANELGCLAGYQISRSLHRRYRDRIELSNFYEPISSSRNEVESNSDQDEDENLIQHNQGLFAKSDSLFRTGTNTLHHELSNVWSDRLDDDNQLFTFNDTDDNHV